MTPQVDCCKIARSCVLSTTEIAKMFLSADEIPRDAARPVVFLFSICSVYRISTRDVGRAKSYCYLTLLNSAGKRRCYRLFSAVDFLLRRRKRNFPRIFPINGFLRHLFRQRTFLSLSLSFSLSACDILRAVYGRFHENCDLDTTAKSHSNNAGCAAQWRSGERASEGASFAMRLHARIRACACACMYARVRAYSRESAVLRAVVRVTATMRSRFTEE